MCSSGSAELDFLLVPSRLLATRKPPTPRPKSMPTTETTSDTPSKWSIYAILKNITVGLVYDALVTVSGVLSVCDRHDRQRYRVLALDIVLLTCLSCMGFVQSPL